MLRPLMPMIRTEFNLSYTEAGILISAFSITSGLSQLPAGWIADRLGPQLMVAIGVSGVAVAGLMIGLSPTYLALIVFLVLSALAGGSYHPASAPAISAIVPSARRGRALGLHSIGGSSSFLFTPIMAAQIAVFWGWRGSYITLSIPIIILGIVLYILIGRRTEVRGAESQTGNNVPSTTSHINWQQLVPFIVTSVATGTMIQSVSSFLSLYAVDQLGATEATAARLMAITPAMGLFVAPLAGYFSDRFGGVLVLAAVSLLAIPVIYSLGVVPNILTFAAVMAVIGVVSYTRMPTSEFYIVGHTPKHRRSTILGFYYLAGSEMAGLLTPVMGILIDRFGFYQSFTIASVTLGTVTVSCLFLLWRNWRLSHKYFTD